jgi:hypothetical protein
VRADTPQTAHLPTPEGQRRARLNRALDTIADRIGSGAVVRGDARPAARAGLSHQHNRGEGEEP